MKRCRLKWFRRPTFICAAAALAGSAFLLHADLTSWAENVVAGSALEAALFRIMNVPGGAVPARRPPQESRLQLGNLIQESPRESDLYAMRAHEDERQLDFASAESDWRRAADLVLDKAAALTDLADFYHRRVEPQKEVDVLIEAGELPTEGRERFRPDSTQHAWRAFARSIGVIDEALLPNAARARVYEAWMARYPADREPYLSYFQTLLKQKNRNAARDIAARIHSVFPNDQRLAMETAAQLASLDGGPNAALAVYAHNSTPLWPTALESTYYELLTDAHQLRAFLASARADTAANPTALAPVLRLYFYYEQEGKREIADQELLNLESRRAAANVAWSAEDLKTVAPLFQRCHDYDESARMWYMLYELPAAGASDKDSAFASLIGLLLDVPEQPLRFAQRDLSLYKNIAQMDRHPGFLNGILSLALNTTFPDYQYQNASQTAVAYFHRAAASRLISRMKQEFPTSPETPALEAKLFAAYAVYGQNEALIRLVPAWLGQNPNSPDYVSTAVLLADAYAQTGRTTEEFALYDKLLADLGEKSEHMPLGEAVIRDQQQPDGGNAPIARSPEYALVLDRYISRLTQLNRLPDVVVLYRHEIDRNPDDAGIYERLALFVEQNRFDADLEQTYRVAMNRFHDSSWADKLGRFYLRTGRDSAYAALTRELTAIFKGSDLASFLTEVSPNRNLNPVLYRQINLYAHQRFPHNLTFVRNLLDVYAIKATADAAAYDKLLRENWYYDAGLRSRFFAYLQRTGKLEAELAALPPAATAIQQKNTAALQFAAEGRAWLTEYEGSAPEFVALARLTPGDRDATGRATAIERSLAPTVPRAFETAIQLARQDVNAAPREEVTLTRVGEIYADRELYRQAAPWWNRVATVEPGLPNGYLDAATVFWDYFQYDDALRVIREARQALKQPARFAYQAGAIYENKGDYSQAIDEYIEAELDTPPNGDNALAQRRLIQLDARKNTARLVEQRSESGLNGAFNLRAVQLRIAILESQQRRNDIHALLDALLLRTPKIDEIEQIRVTANHFGFDDTSARALERLIILTVDPIEKLHAQLELASFRETHNDIPGAARELTVLLNENPDLLGIIRANADFYWRTKQPRQAVSTLAAAASRAQQPFRNELTREAAQKAEDSSDFAEARRLLDNLLQSDPYNGDLLAAKASTYARQGDENGLVQFYASELNELQAAQLPADEKKSRIAGLRRGYITALIAVKRFDEALDQYQEVLNRFPEDNLLAREVARFAEMHQLEDKLVTYYEKTAQNSPRDYRWPLVLARIETSLRRYQDAIASYDKATYVRPDRSDIFGAKADLQVRLLRFDDAIKTNQKLYDLNYHDPQYLAAQADLYARLGNKAEAIRRLRAAYIDPHPEQLSVYVDVMRRLAAWRMYDEVDRVYREAGARMTPGTGFEMVNLEAQALTRLHRPVEALHAVSNFLTGREIHFEGSTARFADSIGEQVNEYLTPEEKSIFAQQIQRPGIVPAEINVYDVARSSQLTDLTAELLYEAARRHASQRWRELERLQSARLLYDQLGHQLEDIVRSWRPIPPRDQIAQLAIRAYLNAGDSAEAMRVFELPTAQPRPAIDAAAFASLFLASGGDLGVRLGTLAKSNPNFANVIVQRLISRGSKAQAFRAIDARGALLSPLWVNSYTALAGLYFQSSEPRVPEAFDAVLGPRTVGGELSQKTGADGALRGDVWFYYAARYGEYLSDRNESGAHDLLPAPLESAPAASDSYVAVGDTDRDLKRWSDAIAEYNQALDLSPKRADIHDRLAVAYSDQHKRTQALDEWRSAFRLLAQRVEEGKLPPSYWEEAKLTLMDANRYGVIEDLRPDADAMLRAYIKRNGAYNFMPFIEGILADAPNRQAAVAWTLELTREPNVDSLLEDLLMSSVIKPGEKEIFHRARIAQARAQLNASAGDAAISAGEQLQQASIQFASYLVQQNRPAEAWQIMQEVQPATARPPDLVLTIAALAGRLDKILQEYRTHPEAAPRAEQILAVAGTLSKSGHADLALRIEDFEYSRELDSENPPASAYFGLAQIRLQQKQNQAALTLIRDVTLSVGAPFENLPEAVTVLEKAGLKQEAVEYATQWKTAEAWNPDAQLSLARLTRNAVLLNAIRQSAQIPYAKRVDAAKNMRDLGAAIPGTGELDLLTHKTISVQGASQPLFIQARLAAAATASNARDQVKLYAEAIALDPSQREPRLAFAAAAFELKRNTVGLLAWQSYQQYQNPSPRIWMQPPDSEYVSAGQPNPEPTAPQPSNLITVEKMAAAALLARHEYSEAIAVYDQLLASVADRVERQRIVTLRGAADAQLRLFLVNSSRQPHVTNEVAQSSIVKPRLTSPPPAGAEQ